MAPGGLDGADQVNRLSYTLAVAEQREALSVRVKHVRQTREPLPLAPVVTLKPARVDSLPGRLDLHETSERAANEHRVVGPDSLVSQVVLAGEDNSGAPAGGRQGLRELLERPTQEVLGLAASSGEPLGDNLPKAADRLVKYWHRHTFLPRARTSARCRGALRRRAERRSASASVRREARFTYAPARVGGGVVAAEHEPIDPA